ncbi:hypothetical protein [Spiroplasma sp. SV19]|uniref:hypothetical protein n=1 Tax=Spiroplasma sp. SV19 TaxID=2570468 RepID=UPI0024B75403|nr:hypothetical protein [Spiroplasma sp. SV19]WHQ37185.1 hypothetical protein E7Y35_04760 [Spiroplasma sp. SV19]
MAVRIEPLSIVGEVALTIYYKNPNYEPIIIMTTAIKAEKFVLAKEPFIYYMNSEWFIGWGTESGGLFSLVSLAPDPVRKVVFDSFKIYRAIAKF